MSYVGNIDYFYFVILKNEDGTIGSLIAYCTVSNSQATDSGYMEFTGVIVNGNVSGIHDIVLKFVTDEGMSYIGNIDNFTFVASSVESTGVEQA